MANPVESGPVALGVASVVVGVDDVLVGVVVDAVLEDVVPVVGEVVAGGAVVVVVCAAVVAVPPLARQVVARSGKEFFTRV